MRRPTFGTGLMTALLLCSPALANEIVYFKNGTDMAVLGHEVVEGMIRVQLAPESSIAFPTEMVDRIVSAGEEVFNSSGETKTFKNQMHEGDPTPVVDTRVGGRPLSHQIRGRWVGNQLEGNPHVGRDPTSGLAVFKPFPDDPNPAKASRGLTGRLDMLEGNPQGGIGAADGSPVGTRPFGRGYIGKMPEDAGQQPMLRELSLKPVVVKPSPPEDSDQ